MNKKLIKILTKARKSSGLIQSEVGELLGGIKGNTISDWERGRTEPDIDTFIELCKIYKINPYATLQYAYDDISESSVIIAPKDEFEEKVLGFIREFNDEGRTKIIEYVVDLHNSKSYEKGEQLLKDA